MVTVVSKDKLDRQTVKGSLEIDRQIICKISER